MKNNHARSHLITCFVLVVLFVSIFGISSARVSSFWRVINLFVVGEAWLCESGIRVYLSLDPNTGPHEPQSIPMVIFSYTSITEANNPVTILPLEVTFIALDEPEPTVNGGDAKVTVYAYVEYDFPENFFIGDYIRITTPSYTWTVWDSRDEFYHASCSPDVLNTIPVFEPTPIDYDAHMRNADPNGSARVLLELGAPVAAYCEFGNFRVYNLDVNTGNGSLAVNIPATTLHARVAEAQAGGVNILIAEGARSTQVWALSSGEIQVNAYDLRDTSKLYEHIFSANVCG